MSDQQFDPENVRRYNFRWPVGAQPNPDGVIVKHEDYARLLALYNALKETK